MATSHRDLVHTPTYVVNPLDRTGIKIPELIGLVNAIVPGTFVYSTVDKVALGSHDYQL